MSKKDFSKPLEKIKKEFSMKNIGENFIIRKDEPLKKKIEKRIIQIIMLLSLSYTTGKALVTGIETLEFKQLPKSQQKIVLEINQKYGHGAIQMDIFNFNRAMEEMNWAKKSLEKGNINSCLNKIISAKGYIEKIKVLDKREVLAQILEIEKEWAKLIKEKRINK